MASEPLNEKVSSETHDNTASGSAFRNTINATAVACSLCSRRDSGHEHQQLLTEITIF